MPNASSLSFRLDRKGLIDQLNFYSVRNDGNFSITLVNEKGPGYNLVLHDGSAAPKTRISLVFNPADPASELCCTSDARDIIAVLFTRKCEFDSAVATTIDTALSGLDGSVRLEIEDAIVARAHFHEGELWP